MKTKNYFINKLSQISKEIDKIQSDREKLISDPNDIIECEYWDRLESVPTIKYLKVSEKFQQWLLSKYKIDKKDKEKFFNKLWSSYLSYLRTTIENPKMGMVNYYVAYMEERKSNV